MFYKVFILILYFQNVYTANNAAEILWNLTSVAIESRQNFYQNFQGQGPYYPFLQNQGIFPPPRPGLYQNHKPGQYGLLQYPQNYFNRPQLGYPNPQKYPNYGSPYPQTQSFMDVLNTLARNDELQCVPRLLCEFTSGNVDNINNQDSSLPFNINMGSILGFLGSLNGLEASPILSFGKAALLGYASKGNSASCMYAYPRCPHDPDKLVAYLNNYNGGFFRFFNGRPMKQTYYPQYKKGSGLGRILTRPNGGREITFPLRENIHTNVVFPQDFNELRPYRVPKELEIPILTGTRMVFPDRTGTGDLRLDPEELDYNRNNYNTIRFVDDLDDSNHDFYVKSNTLFTFPHGDF